MNDTLQNFTPPDVVNDWNNLKSAELDKYLASIGKNQADIATKTKMMNPNNDEAYEAIKIAINKHKVTLAWQSQSGIGAFMQSA